MSSTDVTSDTAAAAPATGTVEFKLEVVDMDGRRVDRVLVRRVGDDERPARVD